MNRFRDVMWQGAAMLLALSAVAAPVRAQFTRIEAVVIHPPVAAPLQCSEHALGSEDHVPDALGSDCTVVRRSVDDQRDAVKVAYIHVREVLVHPADTVRAGQPVARIGNNGSSYHPHVHVGAFRGELFSADAVPIQIRMDLAAMGQPDTTPRQD